VTSYLRRLGDEVTAHAIATGNQHSPAVAALVPGGYVVVWSDQNGDGSGQSIHAQRFDSSGAKIGAELLVNSTAFESQNNPVVVGLSSGGFAVAWIHQDPQGGDGIGMSIRARVFGADGAPLAADFLVNTSIDGQQNAPALVALADGGFVAIWHGPLAGGEAFEIVAQRFSAAGAKVGVEFRANAAVAGGQDYPSGAALEGGGYVLVWNHAAGAVGDGDDVRGQRFDSQSNPVGAEFVLSTPNGSGITPGRQYQPDVAGLPGGGFVAVWQSFNSALGRWEARGQIFGADGARVGSEFVASNAADDASAVTVASLSWGGFIVGWDNAAMSASASERAQLFDSLGGRLGDQAQLNLTSTGLGPGLDLAGTAGGRFVATWRDSANDVKVQLFAAGIHGTAGADTLGGTGMDDDLYGHSGDDILHGNGGNDDLRGGSGHDRLDGGSGADSMSGGTGDDFYVVDNGGDTITELADEGTDEVRTALAVYSLVNFPDVENLSAIYEVDHDLRGNGSSNVVTGFRGSDVLRLQDGGVDSAIAGSGNDQIFYGAALTPMDSNDGGPDTDVLVLQGDYSITLAAWSLTDIEYLSLQSGSSTRYEKNLPLASHDYNITFIDSNVGAGQRFVINASQLLAGEDFTFDGSAETNGSFLVYGGFGADVLTGGAGHDVFHFEGSRWGSGDSVNGGAGADSMVIRAGSGVHHIEFSETQLTSVESISVSDRFGLGQASLPSYEMVLANGNVAPGATLIVNGSTLLDPGQFIDVDGSAVRDGHLKLYGGAGADTLIGGAGNDLIFAAGGADRMTGGEGQDTFQFRSLSDSTVSAPDEILDFVSGVDKIDLGFIDANSNLDGNQVFSWIGTNAFGGAGAASAGQLRAYQSGGDWFVEGDTNGDGTADLVIQVTADALVQGDFLP
jgi:Ca2+-binding RTX toxin-like protein